VKWQTGVVVPIFKKVDRRVCSNSRGITLCSLPGKVYSRVLERRLQLIQPRRNNVDTVLALDFSFKKQTESKTGKSRDRHSKDKYEQQDNSGTKVSQVKQQGCMSAYN